jgi:hypothetical protein
MDGLYENFRIALHQVWQRRWLALAVAWVIAAAGWAAITFIPNSYEANPSCSRRCSRCCRAKRPPECRRTSRAICCG